eukprot:6211982-Pleurochrysis_carterae.AAC.7
MTSVRVLGRPRSPLTNSSRLIDSRLQEKMRSGRSRRLVKIFICVHCTVLTAFRPKTLNYPNQPSSMSSRCERLAYGVPVVSACVLAWANRLDDASTFVAQNRWEQTLGV